MKVVPLGPRRGKLLESKDYNCNWQHVQPKVNNKREDTLKYEIKHIALSRMNQQLLYRMEKNQNKLSWNNLFINQIYLLAQIYCSKEFPKNV